MDILFIAPVKSQARYYKRIMALKKLGANCQILYFERDYYEGKAWTIKHKSLGTTRHGHYYSRIIDILKAIPTVRSESKNVDVLYAFGLDMLLLAIFACKLVAKKPKIVYELADLGLRTKNTVSARLITFIEKQAIRFVDKLILTSQGYYEGYFKKVSTICHSKVSVIENKVDLCITNYKSGSVHNNSSKLTIGYFGILRSKLSLQLLIKLAAANKNNLKLLLAGKFIINDLNEEFRLNIENIEFIGPYTSPDDFPMLYNRIDMAWVVNDHRNAKYMRTNRFYESCFFQTPLITQVDSYDGKVVEELDIGLSIDVTKHDYSIKKIQEVTKDDIQHWKGKLIKLPQSVYVYNDEHEKLYSDLKLQ